MPDKELTEYWKKKYKDLPIDYSQAEGKDVNINWMKARRLKYGGEDGGGHFWVDHRGRKYYFQDLPRKGEREPQNDVTVTQPGYPVGTVPEVPDYTSFPAQSGAYASGLNESFMQELRKSKDDVLSSKHDVLDSWADVLKSEVTEDVLGTKKKSKNENLTKEENDCDRKSHFYIVDLHNKVAAVDGSKFFMQLNERCGNIFSICPDGKVLLIKGKDPENVPVTETTSRILAKTVNSAINGGVGYNHARIKHKVLIEAIDTEYYNDNNSEKNRNLFFDSYDLSVVDYSDYKNVLRRILPNDFDYPNEIIQAAFMGHFIVELCTGKQQLRSFSKAHNFAIKRESEILMEMLRLSGTTTREKETIQWVNEKMSCKRYYYPLIGGKNIVIKIYLENLQEGDKNGVDKTKEIEDNNPHPSNNGLVIGANIFIGKPKTKI